MAKKIYIDQIAPDAFVQSTFLVTSKVIRQTRQGQEYLSVTLSDRGGSLAARAWDEVATLASRFEEGDYVAVRAQAQLHQQTLQLTLMDLERLEPQDVDARDYLPASRWPGESMLEQLRALLQEQISSPVMQAFLRALLEHEPLVQRLLVAPAATSNHHAYLGGLLEHALSMMRLAVMVADHYARYYPKLLNKDLLLAGCLLHDLGKVRELAYESRLDYTTHGRLIGHIAHGVELIEQAASRMSARPPEDMLLQLKHLVLSHHGRLDYGSPVRPQTPEAIALHEIDMLDSRMNMCWMLADATRCAAQGASPAGGSRWSEPSRALDGRLYLGDADLDKAWRVDPPTLATTLRGPGLADEPQALTASRPTTTPTTSPAPSPAATPTAPHTTLDLFGD